MSDNLTKGRIQKLLNQISKAGLELPFDPESIVDMSEREATVKQFWLENKPNEETKEQAKAAISKEAEDRIADLEAKLAENTALMTKFLESQGKTQSGISTDELMAMFRKAADGTTNEYKLMRQEYIPEGDLMEKAEVFFVANNNHRIWGKRIGDHWTPPPFKIDSIHFRLAWGWVSREGNSLQQKRISTFETKSRTISEWIKSHPEFGRIVHLDLDEAMESSDKLTFAGVHAKHFGAYMGKSYNELTSLAAQAGIGVKPNHDSAYYAGKLAEIAAEREIAAQRANFERQMRSNITMNAVTSATV